MDIELLKTFLEVRRTRHFGRAAENLYLTQSAVSARVRQLEQYLGTSLFVRSRNNIHPTTAGERLAMHAESLLNAWERARQDIALAQGRAARLTFAGLPSIWDSWLQSALQEIRDTWPDLALGVDILSEESLARRLQDDAIDLALCFEPPKAYDLEIREMATIALVLVASQPQLTPRQALEENYIFVDWGPGFKRQHADTLGTTNAPLLHTGSGRIALDFLLANGGAAYLPEPVVQPYLTKERLFAVAEAPRFERRVQVAFKTHHRRRELIDQVVERLSANRPFSALSLRPDVVTGS